MLALLRDKAGAKELGEVKRQRAVGNCHALGDLTRRETVSASLHQETKHREAMLLRQRCQSLDCPR